jgi:hypothetical protein
MVPESYVVGKDQLINDERPPPVAGDKLLAVRVKVGWVEGLNRLYFLYESEDDFWEFSESGLRNDIFEVVVDGDASGGPFLGRDQQRFWTPDHVGVAAGADSGRLATILPPGLSVCCLEVCPNTVERAPEKRPETSVRSDRSGDHRHDSTLAGLEPR